MAAIAGGARRIVALHECTDGCRTDGCVLVHKGYTKARFCSSCGSMGGDCFAGCEADQRDRRAQFADSIADRAADAAFDLPDHDTTGPNDPYAEVGPISSTEAA